MTEWDAAEYARRSSLQEAMAEEALALLNLEGSQRVLDVGCGDGKITAQIAARLSNGTVTGVDSSQDMIGFASSHFGPTLRPNLRFEVADARCLPFREEFDLVVSFNALHWVPEQEAALYEAPFAYVREHVRPVRQQNRRDAYRLNWWRHVEPRPGMWRVLETRPR